MESESGTSIDNAENKEEENPDDPFAYLTRHFSNEAFKIVIKNLPTYYGLGELRTLLNKKLFLNSKKVKQGKRYEKNAFICFGNEEDRQKALETLKGYKWKGTTLDASIAKASPDPLVVKRNKKRTNEDSNKKLKRDKSPDLRTPDEKLKALTIPLSEMPYEEQLKLKYDSFEPLIRSLTRRLLETNMELRPWITRRSMVNGGLICPVEPIKYATKIDGYRNKCDFSFGVDKETNRTVVGFRLGSYADGNVDVGPVDNLRHVPDEMKAICKIFGNFVDESKLTVFDLEVQHGNFRQLLLRVAKGQIMMLVGIHPQELTEDELKEFKANLVDYFTKGPGGNLGITSIYYKVVMKKTSADDYFEPEHLWGETHLHETILGLKFKVSPDAFFQINSECVEILYQTAIDLAQPTPNTTILDVCCGTGTIGLCFAKYCGQVLGLELNAQAIADAHANAEANNITSCRFFACKAEDSLGTVCFNSVHDEIIAILDPPRAGLHLKAIVRLRKLKKIKKIIYFSCDPDRAFNNFADLGRPESKTMQGEPFFPVKAVPVDMFPHTKHCELIILFERYKGDE